MHVSAYIQTERQCGAICDPFANLRLHLTSSFLTIDNPNSDKRRVILDLSLPPGQFVNDGVPRDKYLGSYFELKYPSIDDILASLWQLGTDTLLYKTDLSHAF